MSAFLFLFFMTVRFICVFVYYREKCAAFFNRFVKMGKRVCVVDLMCWKIIDCVGMEGCSSF